MTAGRVIFSLQGQIEDAIDPFLLDESYAQILYPSVVLVAASTLAKNAIGGIYRTATSFAVLANVQNAPAKQTDLRIFEIIFNVTGALAVANSGAYVQFNRQDGSNYWQVAIYESGVQYFINLHEIVGGSGTLRASDTVDGDVDFPTKISLQAQDFGDTVMYFCGLYESDAGLSSLGSNRTYVNGYTPAGARNFKNEVGCYYRFYNQPTSELTIESFSMEDV